MAVLSVMKFTSPGFRVLKSKSGSFQTSKKFLSARDIFCAHLRGSAGHGPRTMVIQPSRWQWMKFKDLLHYYAMLGLIPVTIIITATNLFIGPAQLAEIPKDYEPKHWEYYRHPITRFLARNILPPPQQEYEKYMHFIFETEQKVAMKALENKVYKKMNERADYQSYYFRPPVVKYHRIAKEAGEDLIERGGN